MMQHLAKQGVVHAEVYISVGVIYLWRNFDPGALEPSFAALERARERGERELAFRFIGSSTPCALYDRGGGAGLPQGCRNAPPLPIDHRHRSRSDERRAGSEPFRAHYARAGQAGLRLTNHAGETTGPDAIWEALAIGSERIGHAVSQSRTPLSLRNLERATSRWS